MQISFYLLLENRSFKSRQCSFLLIILTYLCFLLEILIVTYPTSWFYFLLLSLFSFPDLYLFVFLFYFLREFIHLSLNPCMAFPPQILTHKGFFFSKIPFPLMLELIYLFIFSYCRQMKSSCLPWQQRQRYFSYSSSQIFSEWLLSSSLLSSSLNISRQENIDRDFFKDM